MSEAVEIILPAKRMDALCDALVEITAAIDASEPGAVAHGFLGGEHGYGADWNSPAFEMRPFYWGDCDCGYEERSEAFWSKNAHASDCYQTELRQRMADYDRTSGYAEIDRRVHEGDDGPLSGFETETDSPMPGMFISISRPRTDAAMADWRAAYDLRRKFEDRLYKEMQAKFNKPERGRAVHCTCGLDERAKAYFQEQGHRATCALELPNFRHKATGFEVRWYKYIGRDMETLGPPPPVDAMLAECLADVAAHNARVGGGETGTPSPVTQDVVHVSPVSPLD